MRTLFLAALLSVGLTAAAFADQDVAGKWHANVGSHVTIEMSISPDAAWSSQTLQKKKVVRSMKGTYTQTPGANGTGTLVFTPTQASTTTGGAAQTETDQYDIVKGGKELRLTSDGDTMIFHKQ